MFAFFKKENSLGSLIKKTFGGFFIFFFMFSAAFAALPTEKVSAESMYGIAKTSSSAQAGVTEGTGGVGKLLNMAAAPFLTVVNLILSTLAQVILGLSSFFLWGSAELFETVIQYSVIELSTYAGGSSGILAVWKTFRDIGNMFFIFILLYISIQIILGVGGVNLKKILSRVIIVALLINFSLFFTQLAIDASNIISIGFYNQIVQTKCGSDSVETFVNIGGAFMCKLGITSLFSADISAKFVDVSLDSFAGTMKILTIAVMGSLFMLIAAFVFLAAGLMFVVRFITLVFLLMLSPLAFAATALPDDKYSSKWFSALISNCILAPVYMAATWAVLSLMNGLTTGGGSMLDAILGTNTGGPSPEAGETFLRFVIVIGMMVATLIVASEFGGYGAGGALKMLQGAQGWAQGKLGRGLVRATVKPLDERFAKSNFGKSWAGTQLREITSKQALGTKFGSKDSVESIDKKRKKAQKDMPEDMQKGLQTDLDKNIVKMRDDFITENEKKLRDLDAEEAALAPLKAKADAIRKTIASDEQDVALGIPIAATKIAADKKDLADQMKLITDKEKEIRKEIGDRDQIKKDISATIDSRQADFDVTNDAKKGFATKQEIARWMPGMQKNKAQALVKAAKSQGAALIPSYKKDLEKSAEELMRKARGVGAKDKKQQAKEYLESLDLKPEDVADAPASAPAAPKP